MQVLCQTHLTQLFSWRLAQLTLGIIESTQASVPLYILKQVDCDISSILFLFPCRDGRNRSTPTGEAPLYNVVTAAALSHRRLCTPVAACVFLFFYWFLLERNSGRLRHVEPTWTGDFGFGTSTRCSPAKFTEPAHLDKRRRLTLLRFR